MNEIVQHSNKKELYGKHVLGTALSTVLRNYLGKISQSCAAL